MDGYMTREQANEILTMWKLGLELYPARIISLALYVTGDLESPTGEVGK